MRTSLGSEIAGGGRFEIGMKQACLAKYPSRRVRLHVTTPFQKQFNVFEFAGNFYSYKFRIQRLSKKNVQLTLIKINALVFNELLFVIFNPLWERKLLSNVSFRWNNNSILKLFFINIYISRWSITNMQKFALKYDTCILTWKFLRYSIKFETTWFYI